MKTNAYNSTSNTNEKKNLEKHNLDYNKNINEHPTSVPKLIILSPFNSVRFKLKTIQKN